jgi:hypothetical protein
MEIAPFERSQQARATVSATIVMFDFLPHNKQKTFAVLTVSSW